MILYYTGISHLHITKKLSEKLLQNIFVIASMSLPSLQINTGKRVNTLRTDCKLPTFM